MISHYSNISVGGRVYSTVPQSRNIEYGNSEVCINCVNCPNLPPLNLHVSRSGEFFIATPGTNILDMKVGSVENAAVTYYGKRKWYMTLIAAAIGLIFEKRSLGYLLNLNPESLNKRDVLRVNAILFKSALTGSRITVDIIPASALRTLCATYGYNLRLIEMPPLTGSRFRFKLSFSPLFRRRVKLRAIFPVTSESHTEVRRVTVRNGVQVYISQGFVLNN